MVQSVVSAVESLAAEKRLRLTVDVAPDLPVGRGDERRITQVLLNLVGNAIKFTEKGEVAVRVANSGRRVPGVGRRHRAGHRGSRSQKIFEEFQQVDSSSTRDQGRHRARARDRQAHRRDARRAHLGRIGSGEGLDVLLQHSGAHR